jgi:hypothetical protein
MCSVLTCTTCKTRKTNDQPMLEMLLELPTSFTPITDIVAVTHPREAGKTPVIVAPEGYDLIPVDLNSGRAAAPYVYLCVSRSAELSKGFITELKVIASKRDAPIPRDFTFQRVDADLNGNIGDQVYLFFNREVDGSPITSIEVIVGDDAAPTDGFKKINSNLSGSSLGDKIYLCYQKDLLIRNIKVSTVGIPNYTFIDTSLAPKALASSSPEHYILHSDSGNKLPVTHLGLIPFGICNLFSS